jgi:hypothetical protein
MKGIWRIELRLDITGVVGILYRHITYNQDAPRICD